MVTFPFMARRARSVATNTNLDSEFLNLRSPMTRKKWLYAGLAAVVVLGGAALIVAPKLQSGAAIPLTDIYQVGTGNVTQTVSTSGTIAVPQEIDLNFNGVSGVVQSVPVKIGQQVTAGQVLAKLNDPSAQTQVTEAAANLLSAQARLTQTQQGSGTPAQVAQDNLNVQRSQQTLAQAKQAYSDQLYVFNDRSAAYQGIQNAQTTLQKDQTSAANSTAVTAAQQNLQAAQTAYNTTTAALQLAQNQYGSITAAAVAYAYQAYVADVDNGSPSATVSAAQTQYNLLNTGYQAVLQAQNAVAQAQNVVNQNQIALTNAQASAAQLQTQIQTDQQNLTYLQQQYNDRTSAQAQLDNAKNAISQDQLALTSAQATLKADTAAPTTPVLEQAEATVTSAQAQLQAAQAVFNSTTLVAPISGVVTQVNLVPGELPTSGGSASSGASATAQIVIDDVNKSDLQVHLQVSEAQIGAVKAGQPLTYTVPAYTNKTFSGTIVTVYPTPQVVSNVTEYTVLASIDNASGSLRTGMTTNATIQTAEHDGVVTIPAVALQQLGALEGVYVYGEPSAPSTSGTRNNGSSQGGNGALSTRRQGNGTGNFAALAKRMKLPKGVYFQPVQTGILGTSQIEITRGLSAGQKILLALPGQTTSATTAQAPSGRSGGLFGGGGGGFGSGGGNRGGSKSG